MWSWSNYSKAPVAHGVIVRIFVNKTKVFVFTKKTRNINVSLFFLLVDQMKLLDVLSHRSWSSHFWNVYSTIITLNDCTFFVFWKVVFLMMIYGLSSNLSLTAFSCIQLHYLANLVVLLSPLQRKYFGELSVWSMWLTTANVLLLTLGIPKNPVHKETMRLGILENMFFIRVF